MNLGLRQGCEVDETSSNPPPFPHFVTRATLMQTAKSLPQEIDAQKKHQEQLARQYEHMVRKIAWKVLAKLPEGQVVVECDDLFTIGMMGLLDADRTYDPALGQPFESFAEFRVRGAMLDELRRRDFFPRRLRAKANQLHRAEQAFKQKHGREATQEELASALGVTVGKLCTLRQETLPYSFVEHTDPTLSLQDGGVEPDLRLEQEELRAVLLEALEALGEREQLVLDLYYIQELTQREIASVLALTEGRVSQIKSNALKQLRVLLADLLQWR